MTLAFRNLEKLANLEKPFIKNRQTPTLCYRLRHMEVAEKPPRLAQQGGWASPRARGECRGGAVLLPLANTHMEVAGKTPEAHTTRRLGVASGTGGVQRGSRAAPPCELFTVGVQRGSRAAPPCEPCKLAFYGTSTYLFSGNFIFKIDLSNHFYINISRYFFMR